ARLTHRTDLTHRPLTGAPEARVALAWPEDATTDLVDDFIGIVRGRTANSTRGRRTQQPGREQAPQKQGQQKQGQQKQGQRKPGKTERSGRDAGRGQRSADRTSGKGRRAAGGHTPKNPRRGKPRRGS
ncbi:LysR family transcriptional regulator, partial [Streptomyces sp. H28]|nr:LysR family transcriptional regulator [Streptomyces sp. H28]